MKSLEINKINKEEAIKKIAEIQQKSELLPKIQSLTDKLRNWKEKELEAFGIIENRENLTEKEREEAWKLYRQNEEIKEAEVKKQPRKLAKLLKEADPRILALRKKWEEELSKIWEEKQAEINVVQEKLSQLEEEKKPFWIRIKEIEFEEKEKEAEFELKKIIEQKERWNKILTEKSLKGEQIVIFVDGARNNWGGKYGITDDAGIELDYGNNSQIYEQIEIEAYAILKGINWAKENNIKKLKIMTDCQVLSYGNDFKSKTKAGTYYWLARKIAKESNIDLEFQWIPGKENKADYLTRN